MARPSARRDDQVRAKMLGEAARILARNTRGFHGTPTSRLGKDESRYFTYFESKEGLLREMFHEYWRRMLTRARAIEERNHSAVERLASLLDTTVEFYEEQEDLFRVTTLNCYPGEISDLTPGCTDAVEFRRIAVRAIEEARSAGRIRAPAIANQVIFLTLVGATQQLLNEHYRTKHLESVDGATRARPGTLDLMHIRNQLLLLVGAFFDRG